MVLVATPLPCCKSRLPLAHALELALLMGSSTGHSLDDIRATQPFLFVWVGAMDSTHAIKAIVHPGQDLGGVLPLSPVPTVNQGNGL